MKKRSTWSFWHRDTGQFNGTQYTGPEYMLAANTPDGHVAVEGVFDPRVNLVDLATGEVVERIPEAPPATDLATWSWHEGLRRHVPVLTLKGRRQILVGRVDALIKAAEGATDRALRDLVIAAGPGAAADRMLRVEAAVVPLRALMDAALAATDDTALDAVEAALGAAG